MELVPVLRRSIGGLVVAGMAAAYLNQPEPDTMEMTVEFERAGLNVRPGDEVRVRGVPVGRISSIEAEPGAPTVRYTLALDPDTRVAADSTANLVPKTLFGDKFVELQPAEEDAPTLAEGASIPVDRTSPSAEVQQVLDKLQPILETFDPVEFSATLSSYAEAFDGSGADIAQLLDDLPPILEEFTQRKGDLARLFEAVPGAAGTFEARAAELARAADHFGDLAELVADDEPEVARFLAGTTDLSARAAELLAGEREPLQGALDGIYGTFDVLSNYPGAITALLSGAPQLLNGLAAATTTGSFRAPIANFGVINAGSLLDTPGALGDGGGGTGVGPDITVAGLPQGPFTLDLGLANTDGSLKPTGLSALLGNLLGGLVG